jgi:hypothetical protein
MLILLDPERMAKSVFRDTHRPFDYLENISNYHYKVLLMITAAFCAKIANKPNYASEINGKLKRTHLPMVHEPIEARLSAWRPVHIN